MLTLGGVVLGAALGFGGDYVPPGLRPGVPTSAMIAQFEGYITTIDERLRD